MAMDTYLVSLSYQMLQAKDVFLWYRVIALLKQNYNSNCQQLTNTHTSKNISNQAVREEKN